MFTVKTLEGRQWGHSGVFIINFQYISHFSLRFIVDLEHMKNGWELCFFASPDLLNTL